MITFREKAEYGFVQLIAWLFRWMPLRLARGVAAILSLILTHVIGLRKKVALDNLQHAFPEKDERELKRIYAHCWRHFLYVGAEMARLPRMNDRLIERWIDLSQQSILKDELEKGKGVIVVSGHFGNWEWMGGAMSKIGFPVTYVVTSQTNQLVERWMNRMRESVGIEIVHRRNAVRGVLSALKRNRAVAILCDQDAAEAGVFTSFFGRLASTPRGPALFSLKTGVPIVFTAAPRHRSGKYRIVFEKMNPENLTGDRENDEYNIMQMITSRMEAEIREYPEQWLWLHRRWKSTPD
ncbi:lysophospholipid acyltransferase family protein [bacterium]|nr:lysophospholipid acyltransferase family protein [bacterium]